MVPVAGAFFRGEASTTLLSLWEKQRVKNPDDPCSGVAEWSRSREWAWRGVLGITFLCLGLLVCLLSKRDLATTTDQICFLAFGLLTLGGFFLAAWGIPALLRILGYKIKTRGRPLPDEQFLRDCQGLAEALGRELAGVAAASEAELKEWVDNRLVFLARWDAEYQWSKLTGPFELFLTRKPAGYYFGRVAEQEVGERQFPQRETSPSTSQV